MRTRHGKRFWVCEPDLLYVGRVIQIFPPAQNFRFLAAPTASGSLSRTPKSGAPVVALLLNNWPMFANTTIKAKIGLTSAPAGPLLKKIFSSSARSTLWRREMRALDLGLLYIQSGKIQISPLIYSTPEGVMGVMANPHAQVPLPPIAQLRPREAPPKDATCHREPTFKFLDQVEVEVLALHSLWLNLGVVGPIGDYLHKTFPSAFFLIKPQAYLSSVSNQALGHHRIDFHGIAVNQDRKYPDFTICQFFGADDDNTPGDVIRVVYEIGTKTDALSKDKVLQQVRGYLDTVTDRRFDERLLGVAQVGNEVYLLSNHLNVATFISPYPNTQWISLFDPRISVLTSNAGNEITAVCASNVPLYRLTASM
ncbi:hypothetical protein DFH07DRAFT_784864 [Mycena maculata]|uniref:Uncharacterized protein n=1 Tax=Mycena maculata TaxID=230809 RepID=A0AAD7HET9_9AGAR|nr:hypothetical protein DFH07DRAFT_784864 [Mycena maculata]